MAEKFRGGEPIVEDTPEEDKIEVGKENKIYRVICSWCGKDMGTKKGIDDGSGLDISHTICYDCLKKYFGKSPEDLKK